MGRSRIYPWRKMPRSRAPSTASGTFFVAQPWADCITNMLGFNLRQAQAFGTMWASDYPGISSMGRMMALALLCTMTAAVLFQPVLMGKPRQIKADSPVNKHPGLTLLRSVDE